MEEINQELTRYYKENKDFDVNAKQRAAVTAQGLAERGQRDGMQVGHQSGEGDIPDVTEKSQLSQSQQNFGFN